MKRILPLLLSLLLSASAYSQITFVDSKTTWETLSKRASSEGKLIFIHFENKDCSECNWVATQGFSHPGLKEIYDKNFIAIRVSVDTEQGEKLQKKLNVEEKLVSVYTDADGNILSRQIGSTSAHFEYKKQAELAMSRRNEKPLKEFEKQYETGDRSPAFLKQYIAKRRELQLSSDSLLNEYVGKVTIDSLGSYEVVKFIFRQAPVVSSRAYTLMRAVAPNSVVDSLYRTIGYEEAVKLNNAIINNSLRKAISNRDQNLAYQTSNFVHGTYGKDFNAASMASQRIILQYYLGLKDTLSYISQAREFVERNYMRISADSLERIDEQMQQRLRKNAPNIPGMPFTQVVRMAPPSQFYHIQLNEFAWNFYNMSKARPDLEAALMWSKRSIEWFEEFGKRRNMPTQNPAYLDTYAHLLYKLNKKEEAITWQTKAVEALKTMGRGDDSIQRTLEKMKAGTL